jgi:hypothetical protein
VALHLLSAAKLAADLADDAVHVREQAIYFAVSAAIWLVPAYLNVFPAAASSDALGKGLWYAEFIALVLVNFAGAFHCLRQCRVDPRRHFLVDCSCLMAPVTLLVIAVTWLAFYVVRGLAGAWWPNAWPLERFLHFQDALVLIVLVGQLTWIYRRVGKYMARAAEMRSSALAPAPSAVTLG